MKKVSVAMDEATLHRLMASGALLTSNAWIVNPKRVFGVLL